MTQRFTVHEVRPVRGARPQEPAPATATAEPAQPAQPTQPDKPGKSGAVGPREVGRATETGGPSGPEPTRYGDWERKGICVDF